MFHMSWGDVTGPQSNIIGSFITVSGALGAVIFGSWLFRGRVNDLKTALDQSDQLLKDHKSDVESTLRDVKASLARLEEQFGTTLESLGQLRASVGDLESAATPDEGANAPLNNSLERLKNDWTAIRDTIEMIAANPELHGQTRAKYARVDRRQYGEFWKLLNADGALGENGPKFKQAIELWQRYKTGRRTPTQEDVNAMGNLRRQISNV